MWARKLKIILFIMIHCYNMFCDVVIGDAKIHCYVLYFQSVAGFNL